MPAKKMSRPIWFKRTARFGGTHFERGQEYCAARIGPDEWALVNYEAGALLRLNRHQMQSMSSPVAIPGGALRCNGEQQDACNRILEEHRAEGG